MNIELQLINSLDDIDFDYLFSESFSRMEKGYMWPADLTTYEMKKEYYRSRIEAAIAGDFADKNDDDTFLMLVTKVDGVVVEFTAGYLEAGGLLSLWWHLTAPAPGSNRNWRYSPEARQARNDFMTSIGAVGTKEYTWVGSLHYRTLKSRAATGNFTLEEHPIRQPAILKPMVMFITRFN